MRRQLSGKKILSASTLLFASLTAFGCVGDKDAPSAGLPPQNVSITISPKVLTLPTGGEHQFSTSVSGSGNTTVNWTILEGAVGGVISSTAAGNDEKTPDGTFQNKGLYTAPISPGIYHIVATSQIDPSKTATATVTVSTALNASFGSNGTAERVAFGGIDTIKAMAVQSDGKLVVGGESLDGTRTNFALARYLPDGSIDPSFGLNGIVMTDFGGSAVINALAIQADGKIVAGGNTDTFQFSAFALARYHTDGTLDTTFGPSSNGKITARPGSLDNRLNALELQGDKILVGGVSFQPLATFVSGGKDTFTLMRFQADGSVDTTFGTDGNGIVKTLFENMSGTKLASEMITLAIQPTGEIVAGGWAVVAGQDFALARYDSNGNLDTSFSGDGMVITSISTGIEQVNALMFQPTGEIVAGGFALNFFALVRYDASGNLDTSFNGSGILTTSIGSGGSASIHSLFFDSNRITAGGISFNGINNSEFTLARYDLTGTLDATFGAGGIVTTPVSTGVDGIQAMQLASDKILAAGFSSDGPRVNFALARYDAANGNLDTGFDTDGLATTAIGSGSEEINALAIQATGEIIAAGFSFGINNIKNKAFALTRYDAGGSLDTSFGPLGRVTTSISGGVNTGDDVINTVAIQTDGKIVVGGSARPVTTHDFALARYLPNGTLDTTFGSTLSGVETLSNTAGDETINALALQSNGKIVVGGTALTGGNDNFIVGRYNANGTLDTSFATGGIATTQIGTGSSMAEAMVIQQSDGKIVLAGSSEVVRVENDGSQTTTFDFALARYNVDGSLDTNGDADPGTHFDTDGIVTTPIGTGNDFAKAIKIQADGKILVGGTIFSSTVPEQFALVRYNPDGSLDTGFGSNGIVITPFGSVDLPRGAQPFAMAIQASDGKILVGGFSTGMSTSRDFSLVRYNPDGTLDAGFGVDGIEISPFSTQIDEIHALTLLTDGTILAGGFLTDDNGENTDFHLAAYTP